MKKFILIISLFFLHCNFSVFAQDNITYTSYKDAVRGISLSYPSTWKKINDSSIALGFMSPKGPKDKHADLLFSLDIIQTEEESAKRIMDQYEKVSVKEFIDYKKIKTGTQKIGQYDCAKLYFEATPDDVKLLIMICIFVDSGNEYVFTCSAKPAMFKKYNAVFDKMIESFKTSE